MGSSSGEELAPGSQGSRAVVALQQAGGASSRENKGWILACEMQLKVTSSSAEAMGGVEGCTRARKDPK